MEKRHNLEREQGLGPLRQRLELLADEALSLAEEQALLRELESIPGGWRLCALTLLEARAFRRAFRELLSGAPASERSCGEESSKQRSAGPRTEGQGGMLVLTEQHDREDRGKVSSDARAVLHGAAGPTTVPRGRRFFRGQLNRFVGQLCGVGLHRTFGIPASPLECASNPELRAQPRSGNAATQQNSPVASSRLAYPAGIRAPVVSGRRGRLCPRMMHPIRPGYRW